MRANAQLARLAERLFPGSSYDELLVSPSVAVHVHQAEERIQQECEIARQIFGGGAWADLRHSLAESLAWMLLFRVPGHRLQVSIDSWIQAQCEMLERLVSDRAEIEVRFGRDARQIVSLDLDLSDRHNGRTVAAVTFNSGLRLIYKPRDLSIDSWFVEFQARLNELGAPLPFQTLQFLTREGYGWTEFATHAHCRSEEQLQRFYRNAGALLCILHLLRATDCHFENLIACGEHPVLVDAETLFQPSLSSATETLSVLRTGMLPRPSPLLSPSGASAADLGALSALTAQTVPVPIPALNGDRDRLETAMLIPDTNVPLPPGYELNPNLYVEEMVDGFRQTWQFAQEHRGAILHAIDAASEKSIRYVFRDTLSYYQSIVAALYAGRLEGLTLPSLTGAKTAFAPLEASELFILRQLDIPRFTLCVADTSLGNAAGCFPVSGYDLVRTGIEGMCDEEMEKQAGILRVCWGLYGAAKFLVPAV